MFENPQVAADSLPAVDDVDWQALDAHYVTRLQLQTLAAGAAASTGVLVIRLLPLPIPHSLTLIAFIALAFIVAGGLAWHVVSVPRKRYAIRDRDILYRSGVFWQSLSATPINRVQHVETSSTPLDRRFRLASLQLYTAGGSGGDLKIHGLPSGIAERLRVFVLARVGEEAESD